MGNCTAAGSVQRRGPRHSDRLATRSFLNPEPGGFDANETPGEPMAANFRNATMVASTFSCASQTSQPNRLLIF